MRGQVLFFYTKKNFGFIVAEQEGKPHDPLGSRTHIFFGSEWRGETVHRNEWVKFASFENPDPCGRTPLVAADIWPIECPPEYLLHGVVSNFFLDRNYGFIDFEREGQPASVFFHINDVLLIDGREFQPCSGCKVSFCLGQKTGREIATQIKILSWPQGAAPTLDIEEHFLSLPDDPPSAVPEPEVSVLLMPANRTRTLLELIAERSRPCPEKQNYKN